jgi:opacity protein-like surface antigen
MSKVQSSVPARLLLSAVLASALLVPALAAAQGPIAQARSLVKEAMDAYSSLDLETAQSKLDKALELASEIDEPTLARVYVSYGVLHIGGFTDNAKGQQSFMIALCLDDSIMVDPLLSTPEIDMLFTMAKNQVNPSQCQQTLSTIVTPQGGGGTGPGPGPGPGPRPSAQQLPQCGSHQAPVEQRKKYELPVYLDLATQMHGRVNQLVLKYAFDGGTNYSQIPFQRAGRGFGAQISCDEGQIRIFDPSSIEYFIEGYDRMGNLVCRHGAPEAPLSVAMSPDAPVLPGIPGMAPPKECAPCAPWDTQCLQGSLPGLDEPCDPATGCAEGLICGDAGLCVSDAGGGAGEQVGPEHFYFNLGIGTGAGYMTSEMEFDKVASGENSSEEYATIEHVEDNPSGMAWSGLPLRAAAGYYIIPRLAIEVTGRLDLKFDSFTEPLSCWDANGQDMDEVMSHTCTGDPTTEEDAKKSVAQTSSGDAVERSEMLISWLVNLRARYDVVSQGGLRVGLFGGVGYGNIKYRIAAEDSAYFPRPGFIDIELGANLLYYFVDNYGMGLEIPIDLMVGDGFALNFEIILYPVSVGF